MAATKAKSEATKDDGAVAQATVKRLAKQAEKCDRLAAQVSRAQIAFKAAKSDYENAVEELRSMSREPLYPLLDTDNAWRGIDIAELGLSEKLTGLLESAVDGDTMGALADWLNADHSVLQITGFGPAAVEKFDDAMAKFWEEHPQTTEDSNEEGDGDE